MDNNRIGKFIANLRKENNLTQKELGKKLYVTNKAVSKWERGLSIPDVAVLENMSKLFGVEISEILDGCRNNKEEDIDARVNEIVENIRIKNIRIRKIIYGILLFLIMLSIYLIIINIKFDYEIETLEYNHNNVIKNIDVGVPKYSFMKKQNDRSYSFKNIRSANVLTNEVKDYLNSLDYSTCNETIYYYSKKDNFSIIEYSIKNRLLFRTISYEIVSGDYCYTKKIEEYSEKIGVLKGIHLMGGSFELDENGNPYEDKVLSVMFIDGGRDGDRYLFEAELKIYYRIWNKEQIILEHSYGTYEIKGNKLYYYRNKMYEYDKKLKIPEVSVFEIKNHDLILVDNYLSKYANEVILEGVS